MERQPSVEELLNIITLQRKALEFYANLDNYVFNQRQINDVSLVNKDAGHQARFALLQSDVAMDYHDSLIDEISKYKKELMSFEEPEESKNFEAPITGDSTDEFKQMLDKIKKLKEDSDGLV